MTITELYYLQDNTEETEEEEKWKAAEERKAKIAELLSEEELAQAEQTAPMLNLSVEEVQDFLIAKKEEQQKTKQEEEQQRIENAIEEIASLPDKIEDTNSEFLRAYYDPIMPCIKKVAQIREAIRLSESFQNTQAMQKTLDLQRKGEFTAYLQTMLVAGLIRRNGDHKELGCRGMSYSIREPDEKDHIQKTIRIQDSNPDCPDSEYSLEATLSSKSPIPESLHFMKK